MCGVAGFTGARGLDVATREARFGDRLRRMLASLRHRGPDALRGVLLDGASLGHARLSIVDLAGGQQPMTDPSTGLTVVFNGEIFNHVELRERLARRYSFRTRSDTEVILAAFLERGIDCVRDFVGQFAFALFDPRDGALWLARDRLGVRPLFYARTDEGFAFASEAKALFAGGFLAPRLDARALLETFEQWAPVAPRTAFEGVSALLPGAVARLDRDGRLEERRYWDLDLSPENVDADLPLAQALAQVEAILADAVRLRLRADVPVAAYLSGGLDSSLVCALAQAQLGGTLQTFSVAFQQERYDERAFQERVAAALGTQHHVVIAADRDVGELLPAVVEHAEVPLLRSAPAPLFALSRLVRQHETKVVLTGEGADEMFLGYDVFKETAIRAFWARRPGSRARPRLFGRLYAYLPLASQSPELLARFYGEGLEHVGAWDASHRLRWANSGRVVRFLSSELKASVEGHEPRRALAETLPPGFERWRPLARAQYLEVRTLLSGYLLSTQGDRMLMGNSVEGRFPFLDHRVVELAARLPLRFKLCGLKEKVILKRLARGRVPDEVVARTKFPYRAPIAEALLGPAAPGWAREVLARDAIAASGVFEAERCARLVDKLGEGLRSKRAAPSEADNMALMAIASTELLRRAMPGFALTPEAARDAVSVEAR